MRALTGDQRSLARFIILFLLLLALFNVYFFTRLVKSSFFRHSLEVDVWISKSMLALAGVRGIIADGDNLRTPSGSLQVKQGCDAIQPLGVFLCALLAFPASAVAKIHGIMFGTLIILCLNIVRIISLYYIHAHYPRMFYIAHIEVWQPLFIVLTLALWYSWARRAITSNAVQTDGTI